MTEFRPKIREDFWRVVSNIKLTENVYEICLHNPEDSYFTDFAPGQFMHIRIPNAPNLLLRRPLSIHDWNVNDHTFTIQYAIVGKGTLALSKAVSGGVIQATANIGRGFPLKIQTSLNKKAQTQKKVWLLGGALGSAPLYSITKALQASEQEEICEINAFLGWSTAGDILVKNRWESATNLRIFTEDGSAGERGFALDGMLKEIKLGNRPDVIYACGPENMYKSMAKTLPKDLLCYVSLESRMACGIGACYVCNCNIKTKNGEEQQRVCVDGPVYSLWKVVF